MYAKNLQKSDFSIFADFKYTHCLFKTSLNLSLEVTTTKIFQKSKKFQKFSRSIEPFDHSNRFWYFCNFQKIFMVFEPSTLPWKLKNISKCHLEWSNGNWFQMARISVKANLFSYFMVTSSSAFTVTSSV